MTDAPSPHVPSLGPLDLERRLQAREALLLVDVREHDERAYCAIPVSEPADDLHLPLNELQGAFDLIAQRAAGRDIVVYCHHGVRSAMAAGWLALRGLSPVLNLTGGIDAYAMEAHPGMPRY